MKPRPWARIVAVTGACGLPACGGGGSTLKVPPAQHSASSHPAVKTVRARLSITVPPASVQGRAAALVRKPQYISTNTKSVTVTINGTPTTIMLTTANPLCQFPPNIYNSPETLQCALYVNAPVGPNVQFAVSTFASTNGTGPALSSQTFTQTITAGATNEINLTLLGIPASAAVEPAGGPNPLIEAHSFPATSITLVGGQTFALQLDTKDASGAVIIGNGSPFLTIAPGPTCGPNAPSPSGSNIQVTAAFSPCGYTVSSVVYDESGVIVSTTPLTPSITISALSAIYVSQPTAVDVYDSNGKPINLGNALGSNYFEPLYPSSFANVGQVAVAPGSPFDALYVPDSITSASPPYGDLTPYEDQGVPLAVPPAFDQLDPLQLGFLPSGAVYSTNTGNIYVGDGTSGNGIAVYSSSGTFAGTISSNSANLAGLAVDSIGNVYATDPADGKLLEYYPGSASSGLLPVVTNLNNPPTSNEPIGVAFVPNPLNPPNGTLYIVGKTGTMTVYNTTPTTTPPQQFTQVMMSGFSGLVTPTGISYDSLSGNLFISDSGAASPILEFNPSTGNRVSSFPSTLSLPLAGHPTGVTVVP